MALSVLQLDKVTPRGGPDATSVVVTGSGFGVVQGSITFDPLGEHGGPYPVVTITLWQDDRIEYVAPSGFSLPDRDNRFYDVHIQKNGATDGLAHPWWVPDSALTIGPPPVSSGLDYQWPSFDAGPNQDVDEPTVWKAADFNRTLDRVLSPDALSLPTRSNKGMTALVTVADGDQGTATAMALTPALGSYVRVLVNGIGVVLGDGVKVGVPSYFSGDVGVTPRSISAIRAGDTWHWNGSVATYELSVTDDVDFDYVG